MINRYNLADLPFTKGEIEEAKQRLFEGSIKDKLNITEHVDQGNEPFSTKLILMNEMFGSVSIKPSNFKISWKSLLLSGGISFLKSTLISFSILGLIAKGVVHIFDEFDAKILLVAYKSADVLPMATRDFFRLKKNSLGSMISEDLFMERIVKLANCGALSIDGDIIKLNEKIYEIKLGNKP